MTKLREYSLVDSIATASSLLSVAITVTAGAPTTTLSGHMFTALIACWACVPYLATAIVYHLLPRRPWRSALVWGLLGYAAVDILLRVRSLHFQTGSTDSLVVLFLPAWSPIVVGLVAVGSTALRRVLCTQSEQ